MYFCVTWRKSCDNPVPACNCSWPVSHLHMWLQVSIPLWALVHLPVVVTVTTAMFTPKVRMVLIYCIVIVVLDAWMLNNS